MLFLSSKNSHFQHKGKCKIFVVKMSCICMRMKNDFHISGFSLSLALKQRLVATRKWPLPVKILFHYPPILLFLINAFQWNKRERGKEQKKWKVKVKGLPVSLLNPKTQHWTTILALSFAEKMRDNVSPTSEKMSVLHSFWHKKTFPC